MSFLKDNISTDRGASMVEYGLLVAVIALVALSAVTLLGEKTDETFTTIAGSLEDDGSAQAPGDSDDENGGDQNGGDQNGGDQNGGDQNGGDQNGGDQNGGDQNGGDENGGDENGGDENGGDQNGGDENGGDQQGQPGDDDDDQGGDTNGGSNGDTDSGDQDVEEEEEEEAEPAGPTATGTSSALYWWDSNAKKGQWKADVSYGNDTNRHQYLTLEVTQIDDKGKTSTTIITGFYVGAGSSSTYTVWSNDINKNNKNVKGVVEVQVKVLSVSTSDENWQTYSYDVNGSPASILPPTLP